ncbi:hypothetical protein QTP88_022825 [Uroleucon formosanum]
MIKHPNDRFLLCQLSLPSVTPSSMRVLSPPSSRTGGGGGQITGTAVWLLFLLLLRAVAPAGLRVCYHFCGGPPLYDATAATAARSSCESSSRQANFFSNSATAARNREIRRGSAEKSPRPVRRISFAIGLPPFLCARLRETITASYAPLCMVRVQNDVTAKCRVRLDTAEPMRFSRRERCHNCHGKL